MYHWVKGVFQPHEFAWLSTNNLILKIFLNSYCLPKPEETFMGMAKSHNEKNPSPFCHLFGFCFKNMRLFHISIFFCFFLLNIKANVFSCNSICRSTETFISSIFHIKTGQRSHEDIQYKSLQPKHLEYSEIEQLKEGLTRRGFG